MAREVIVKPLGLVTRPNLYGQYPVGGLVQAQNLVMRAPGILETAPATVLGASYSVANAVVHQLLSLPSAVMFSWVNNAGVWTVFGNTTASTTLPVIAPAYSTTGRITPTVLRDRIVVNSSAAGQYVCDPQDPNPAGRVPPSWFSAGVSIHPESDGDERSSAPAELRRRIFRDLQAHVFGRLHTRVAAGADFHESEQRLLGGRAGRRKYQGRFWPESRVPDQSRRAPR
jgi:hypothetical protein